jgi:hypothetical protein
VWLLTFNSSDYTNTEPLSNIKHNDKQRRDNAVSAGSKLLLKMSSSAESRDSSYSEYMKFSETPTIAV